MPPDRRARQLQKSATEPLLDEESEHAISSKSSRTKRSSSPKPVERSTSSLWLSVSIDIVLFLLCTVFLEFAIVVRAYDGAPVTQHPRIAPDLLRAAQLGPTIFPILFAAVGSRAIKALIQHRLQRGERFGTLDLLSGSTTVFGAFTTQLSLRSFSALGAGLALLWTLSPIGGQASLRIVTVANQTIATPATFQYFSPNHTAQGWNPTTAINQVGLADNIFMSAVLSSQLQLGKATDQWNNVKIPMIESLETTKTPDESGWYDSNDNTTVYSGLLGLPIALVGDPLIASNFSIETSYWSLNCPVTSSNATFCNAMAYANITGNITGEQPPVLGSVGSFTNLTNITDQTTKVSGPFSGFANEAFDIFATNMSSSNDSACHFVDPAHYNGPSRTIFFQTTDQADSYPSFIASITCALCDITTTYVEVRLECVGATCVPARVRRSMVPATLPTWTLLDQDGCGAFEFFAVDFINSVAGHANSPTMLSTYIADPSSPVPGGMIYAPNSVLPHATYATRLGQLLNTYWVAMMGIYSIPQGMNNATGEYDASILQGLGFLGNSSYDYNYSPIYASFAMNASGTQTLETAVIKCSLPWMAALVIASMALMMASLTGLILGLFRSTPDINLNFSGLVRSNEFIPESSVQSALTASERARLMRKVKVRFGDVNPDGVVGHLAFGSLREGGPVAFVEKGRLYS